MGPCNPCTTVALRLGNHCTWQSLAAAELLWPGQAGLDENAFGVGVVEWGRCCLRHGGESCEDFLAGRVVVWDSGDPRVPPMSYGADSIEPC
mmetsp:Transcript_38528/g.80825  ORF Transcript_38528/g.80825 Transcript_38528/m.80825 type:complete len:92 (+) Transcript_38528:127-402(+)